MMQRFRQALEQGGDHVVAALGYTESHLTQAPDDLRAKAYKGALLVLQARYAVGAQAPREGYVRVGASMVASALGATGETDLSLPEVRYLAGVTLALVPDASRGSGPAPEQVLDALVAMPRMAELDPFSQVDALVCRHLLGGDEDALLARAKACDPALTKDVLGLRSAGAVSVKGVRAD